MLLDGRGLSLTTLHIFEMQWNPSVRVILWSSIPKPHATRMLLPRDMFTDTSYIHRQLPTKLSRNWEADLSSPLPIGLTNAQLAWRRRRIHRTSCRCQSGYVSDWCACLVNLFIPDVQLLFRLLLLSELHYLCFRMNRRTSDSERRISTRSHDLRVKIHHKKVIPCSIHHHLQTVQQSRVYDSNMVQLSKGRKRWGSPIQPYQDSDPTEEKF